MGEASVNNNNHCCGNNEEGHNCYKDDSYPGPYATWDENEHHDFFGPGYWDDDSHDHVINHPHIRPDRGVECNDDQLPVFSRVGRGIKGDSFMLRIGNPDDCTQTYLEGLSYDEASKTYHSEWISENINGGELSYRYTLRPYVQPKTFTMTWIYRRPGRCEWSYTTPAIPYIDQEIGSGVGDVWVRTASYDHNEELGELGNPKDDEWNERVVFPDGLTGDDFNAPHALEDWSANITFGFKDGDVLVPNIYDLADILGWPAGDIYNIVMSPDKDNPDWVDVKTYIDKRVTELVNQKFETINADLTKIRKSIDEILAKIYPGVNSPTYNQKSPTSNPGGKVQEDGSILWATPNTARIAMGNLNVYSGDSYNNWIKTRTDYSENDIWSK